MDNNRPQKQGPNQKPPQQFNLLKFLLILMALMIIFNLFSSNKNSQEVTITQFENVIKQEAIEKVLVDTGGKVTAYFPKNNEQTKKPIFAYYLDSELRTDLVKRLEARGINVSMKPASGLSTMLFAFGPILLLVFVWIWFMRRGMGMGGSGGKNPFSFGKSTAKLATGGYTNVTFKDVAGIDEVEQEVAEIVEFLKNPKKFQDMKAKIPKGVLLMGPPGCGKTLLAKALAGEAKVPFYSISGSEFVEMFVGVGASRVRDLFAQAKKNAPCIIFIDELDAVGRQRGAGLGGGHDEREQTLNQILVEMDGFEEGLGVMMIAATNRPDILDPALLRPGRFDRKVIINFPDVKGREAIFKVHTEGKPLAKDVSLEELAQSCPGFSGADIANLVNEAALLAARRGGKDITKEDFYEAQDKIMLGVARKKVLSKPLKEKIAYHEAGHTLLALLTPESDPVQKVSIIPRGRALGVTWQQPIDDTKFLLMTKTEVLAKIKVLLGGRAAEMIIYEEPSTGAGNDLEVATDLAEKMVCRWGMSDLGPLNFGSREGEIFLGRELTTSKNYSDETARKIDEEKAKIIEECRKAAEELLKKHLEDLKAVTKALIKKETLDGKEIEAMLKRDKS